MTDSNVWFTCPHCRKRDFTDAFYAQRGLVNCAECNASLSVTVKIEISMIQVRLVAAPTKAGDGPR